MTSAVVLAIARVARQACVAVAVAVTGAIAAPSVAAAASESLPTAIERWTRQAEAGDPEAHYELARHYDGQTGQAFDRKRSLDHLQRAARHGHVPAQVDLAFRYLNSSEITPADPAESLRWFTSAASRGSTIAQCMLADFHRDGRGGARQDDRKAFELYRRTATTPDACARKSQYELYRMHEAGRGTPRNVAVGVAWLKKSAQAGNPIAQATLGRAYLQGKGLPKDDEQGRFWLKQSRKGVAPHDDDDHDDDAIAPGPGAHGGGHRHP